MEIAQTFIRKNMQIVWISRWSGFVFGLRFSYESISSTPMIQYNSSCLSVYNKACPSLTLFSSFSIFLSLKKKWEFLLFLFVWSTSNGKFQETHKDHWSSPCLSLFLPITLYQGKFVFTFLLQQQHHYLFWRLEG